MKFNFYILLIILFSCNEKKDSYFDPYIVSDIAFRTKIKDENIIKITISEYKKNTQFQSLLSKLEIKPMEVRNDGNSIHYNYKLKETSIHKQVMNLHHDIKIEIETIDKGSFNHFFSDFKIVEEDLKPFSYYSISYYIYNKKVFESDECDFYLDDSAYFNR